jgi:hypothetical protein
LSVKALQPRNLARARLYARGSLLLLPHSSRDAIEPPIPVAPVAPVAPPSATLDPRRLSVFASYIRNRLTGVSKSCDEDGNTLIRLTHVPDFLRNFLFFS